MRVKIIEGHGWYKELTGWIFEVGNLQNTRLHPYYNLIEYPNYFIEEVHCEILPDKPLKKLNWKKAREEIEKQIDSVPTYREAVLIRDIIEIINNNITEE